MVSLITLVNVTFCGIPGMTRKDDDVLSHEKDVGILQVCGQEMTALLTTIANEQFSKNPGKRR